VSIDGFSESATKRPASLENQLFSLENALARLLQKPFHTLQAHRGMAIHFQLNEVITMKLITLLAFSFFAVTACAAPDDEEPVQDESDAQVEADLKAGKSVMFTIDDNTKRVNVDPGQTIVLKLPSNISTGSAWKVISVDKSLGQPIIKSVSAATRPGGGGSPGSTTLTWSTKRPFDLSGQHPVSLEYGKPGAAPAMTFQITFDVNARRLGPPTPVSP
jgi:predicted secreted protein